MPRRCYIFFYLVILMAAVTYSLGGGIDVWAQESATSVTRLQALVIGNDAYKDFPLIRAVSDARSMADTLEQLGFHVTEKENLGWKQMNEAIIEFGKHLKKGGVGLFYYAGHGVQVKGINYLIPVGADIRDENEVRYKAVDANLVLTEMENKGTYLNIVILDACRGNPFRSAFRSLQQGLAHMSAPVGTIIAYSTAPGKRAGDDGLYTSELVKQMKVPGKRLVDVFNSVRRTLRLKTNGAQVPWESTSLEYPFYFIPPNGNEGNVQLTIPQQMDGDDFDVEQTQMDANAPSPMLSSDGQVLPKVFIDPATGMEFVWVPGGCYEMGCGEWAGDCEDDEMPVHQVCLDGFWMGKYEVTNEQFWVFLEEFGSRGPVMERWFKTRNEDPVSPILVTEQGFEIASGWEKKPVTNVSWYGAKAFVKWMATKSGNNMDLPTETQWEYAARSGGLAQMFAGGNEIDHLGWCATNSETVRPVGEKAPNGLGIFDLTGNVWEWCRDIYSDTAYSRHQNKNPIEFRVNTYTANGAARVIRGGSYRYDPNRARCANRGSHWLAGQSVDLGFRVVINAPQSQVGGMEYTAVTN